MADLKSRMTRHLRSAKQWLTSAEESFDKNSNIRGELDLFLAQAELQHARETSCARQWRYKYPLIRHALSFVLAAAVTTAGFGTYWWWAGERNVAAPVQPAVQLAETAPGNSSDPIARPATQAQVIPPAAEEVRSAAPAAIPVSSSQMAAPVAERQLKTGTVSHTEKDNILPPDEMQKIIQVAGRSLRGQ